MNQRSTEGTVQITDEDGATRAVVATFLRPAGKGESWLVIPTTGPSAGIGTEVHADAVIAWPTDKHRIVTGHLVRAKAHREKLVAGGLTRAASVQLERRYVKALDRANAAARTLQLA